MHCCALRCDALPCSALLCDAIDVKTHRREFCRQNPSRFALHCAALPCHALHCHLTDRSITSKSTRGPDVMTPLPGLSSAHNYRAIVGRRLSSWPCDINAAHAGDSIREGQISNLLRSAGLVWGRALSTLCANSSRKFLKNRLRVRSPFAANSSCGGALPLNPRLHPVRVCPVVSLGRVVSLCLLR
jgi:hypothetical protein